MANSAQARKRARQSEIRRQHNASLRSALRSAIKRVRKSIDAGNQADALAAFQASQGLIDRIADKKIVHKNAASRAKSRLMHSIKKLGTTATA